MDLVGVLVSITYLPCQIYRVCPTRMVYLCCISCLRYIILVGSPRYDGGGIRTNSQDGVEAAKIHKKSDNKFNNLLVFIIVASVRFPCFHDCCLLHECLPVHQFMFVCLSVCLPVGPRAYEREREREREIQREREREREREIQRETDRQARERERESEGEREIRFSSCSDHWPQMQECGRVCLQFSWRRVLKISLVSVNVHNDY